MVVHRPLTIDLLAWWLRRRLLVIRLEGSSMAPALEPGDLLLAARTHGAARFSIVVEERLFPDGTIAHQVKRVTGRPGDRPRGLIVQAGYVWLEGDNAAVSSDSRQRGPILESTIAAVIVAALRDGRLIDLRAPSSPSDAPTHPGA